MSTNNTKPDEIKKEDNYETKKSLNSGEDIVFYGDYKKVNSLDHIDYNDFILNKEKKQNLEGFDPKFNDIVDYILRITHEIWEERGVGVIFDNYHNNTIAHNCSTTSSGVLPVISGTLSHLHAFPNRKIVAEDVIGLKMNQDIILLLIEV